LNSTFTKEYDNQISQIDKLFNEAKPLIDLIKIKSELDFIEKSAAGSFLQSFYNGIEDIISMFLKRRGEKLPNDDHWHKVLLNKALSNEYNIIKEEKRKYLEDYMGFRHFFRHTYGYDIDTEKLKILINNANKTWEDVKKDDNENIN